MILRNIPDLCLQHDHSLAVLRVEWIGGHDMSSLRNTAQYLMASLRSLEVRHLLIDMDSVPDLSVEDQVWLGDYWMPELVALGLERFALVIGSNQIHNQLAVDALHNLVQPAIRFDMQYFTDSVSALDWLTHSSERLPALEAEWETRLGSVPAL
ncbi:hypothetical protein [Hymenobacter sp.]|uniref:hypothetical protein n=1 Tax=Hymenobacter sp. TaxID=1898978 RepID=UPI002EDA7C64